MNRQTVSSSNIAEVGYYHEQRVLEVLFHSGRLYQYFDVPEVVYNEMISASSVGGYLNANIKGMYRYARV
jgi:hypothetical protein